MTQKMAFSTESYSYSYSYYERDYGEEGWCSHHYGRQVAMPHSGDSCRSRLPKTSRYETCEDKLPDGPSRMGRDYSDPESDILYTDRFPFGESKQPVSRYTNNIYINMRKSRPHLRYKIVPPSEAKESISKYRESFNPRPQRKDPQLRDRLDRSRMDRTAPARRDSATCFDDHLENDYRSPRPASEDEEEYVCARRMPTSRSRESTSSQKQGTAQSTRDDLDKEFNRQSTFLHPPIYFSCRQIRLIRIIPSDPSAPIQCQFVLGMVDAPDRRYIALSYAWGLAEDLSDIRKIMLDGQAFWIRRNLWDFLHRARGNRKLCLNLFWIDAICIDQAGYGTESIVEKNHQVNMMKDIYSNARKVISWLGEPEGYMDQAIKDVEGYLAFTHWAEHTLIGFCYLTSLKYWSRMWIVQELVLAKRILVRCGDYHFKWDDICTLWKDYNYAKYGPSSSFASSDSPRYDIPYKHLKRFRWGKASAIISCYTKNRNQHYSVLDALLAFYDQECSNPLEKIYGLLGLVERPPITADYNKDIVTLYEDLIRYTYAKLKFRIDDPEGKEGRFAYNDTDTCKEKECKFPLLLQDALGVPQWCVEEIHTRLAQEYAFNQALIHPFSKECDYWEGRSANASFHPRRNARKGKIPPSNPE